MTNKWPRCEVHPDQIEDPFCKKCGEADDRMWSNFGMEVWHLWTFDPEEHDPVYWLGAIMN